MKFSLGGSSLNSSRILAAMGQKVLDTISLTLGLS